MGIGDKIQNAAEDFGGKAKEAAGNATDNDRLKAEGQKDQVVADAKKVGEDVKDEFKRDLVPSPNGDAGLPWGSPASPFSLTFGPDAPTVRA